MNKKSILGTVLVFLSFLFPGPVIGNQGAFTTGKLPFANTVYTCHETVNISGWFQITLNLVPDSAGGTHFIFHWVSKGTGVGESTGLDYQWNQAFGHSVDNVTAGSTVVANFVKRTHLISQGPLDNSTNYITTHLTVTPDGSISVDRFDLTTECTPLPFPYPE